MPTPNVGENNSIESNENASFSKRIVTMQTTVDKRRSGILPPIEIHVKEKVMFSFLYKLQRFLMMCGTWNKAHFNI